MNQNEASALIIRNINLLEEVTNYLVDTMDEKICKAIDEVADDIIKDWLDESGRAWDLSTDLFEDEIVFGPRAWRNVATDDKKRIAQYSTAFVNDGEIVDWTDGAKLFLSPFVGVSTVRAGFIFDFDYSHLNTSKQKSTWQKFSLNHCVSTQIKSKGFIALKDGNWFLPYNLDIGALAEAFAKDAIEDALDPIRNALLTIKDTHSLFAELVNEAIKSYGTKT
jgi:hypothetical protein